MILKQGPFESLQFADGFVAGVDYLASFLGDFDGPAPTVQGEPYSDESGDNWFVDMDVPDEALE